MGEKVVAATIVGILTLAGIAAFGSGLVANQTASEVAETRHLPEPPRDGSAGIVYEKRTEQHSFLGFQWGRKAQTIGIQMVVPAECAETFEERGPLGELPQGCPAILMAGEYAGSGVNRFGDRIVAIRLEVSRECFDAVSYGDRWPHTSGQCVDGGSV